MDPLLPARAALDLLPVQIWTARVDGTLDYVNAAVTNYFCVDQQQVLDQGWKDLRHPFDLIVAGEKWQRSLATGEPYEVYFRLLRGSDRQFRWHVGRAMPVRSAKGEVIAWAGSNTDIDVTKREQEVALASAALARLELERLQSRSTPAA